MATITNAQKPKGNIFKNCSYVCAYHCSKVVAVYVDMYSIL